MELVVDHLYLKQPINYCPRRYAWSSKGWLPIAKNNAILLSVGGRIVRFNTPLGISEHILFEPNTIVTYRSGKTSHHWWTEDLQLELAIANRYGGGLRYVGALAHERNHYVGISDITEPREDLLDEAINKAQQTPVGRLSKSTARAVASCRFCPVKHQCDATDREHGTDDDWSTSYPFP